jgi:CPA1 family monovalent cation:H+ antiporter
VARRLRPRVAFPGEKKVVAGNPGDAMFFIYAGEVEVGQRPKPVTLNGGEFFGELAMLTGRRRSADVVAHGFCHLLVLEGRDFRKLAKELPELREEIGRTAEQRLKRPLQD